MKKVNTIILIAIAVCLVMVVTNSIAALSPSYIKQIARTGSYTNSFSAKALVIRDELVMEKGSTGIFEPDVAEGDRIAAYARLGTVVTGEISEEKVKELNRLDGEIERITASVSASGILAIDDSKVDATLKLSLTNLSYSASKGDVAKAVQSAGDIKILAERKSGVTSSEIAQGNLQSLISQRNAVADSLGGAHKTIYSPKSGMFSLHLDGMEEVLSFEMLDNITPEHVDVYLELMEQRKPDGVCKIVNNYEWYIAVNVLSKEIDGMKVGGKYFVVFEDSGETELQGELTHISNTDDEGRQTLIFRFTHHIDSISAMRSINVKVCKEKYSGIYIPTSALRVREGVTGVYVQNEKSVIFRCVSIVYRTDEFVLVKETGEKQMGYSGIELYDNMILNPTE